MLSNQCNHFVLFVSLVILVNFHLTAGKRFPDYSQHECLRDCDRTNGPMQCNYAFTAEWYAVLSRSCFECGTNEEDCFRKNCITANGMRRAVNVINRQLPGPSIQVCQGDTVIVNLTNSLHSFESTTIHWHGIKQHGSPHMDGVGMITQCPITPATTFQYKFVASDHGSHIWHGHSAAQRADGLFGALVVRQANDINRAEYDFDLSEHVLVINDWVSDEAIISKFSSFMHSREGGESPDAILINGRGVAQQERDDFHMPLAVFRVKFGKRYRFRVINAGLLFCPLKISIDDHLLTIVATDGNPTEPLPVASVFLLAGERIDFVLNANKPIGNYWIKVQGFGDCADSELFQTAVLRYEKADEVFPTRVVTYETAGANINGPQLNGQDPPISPNILQIDQVQSALDAYSVEYVKKISTSNVKKFYIAMEMNFVKNPEIYDDETFQAEMDMGEDGPAWPSPQFNNITFHLPATPLYYQKDKVPQNKICNEDDRQLACPGNTSNFCSCVHVINVNLHDVVELVFVDGGAKKENHPIHLHGQSFAVLGVQKMGELLNLGDIKKLDAKNQLKRNLNRPPLKDTVTVPPAGYTIVRFYAENPGYWLMHCHIEFHAESGMMLLFKVGNESDLPSPPKNWPQCGNYQNEEPSHELSAQMLLTWGFNPLTTINMNIASKELVSIESKVFEKYSQLVQLDLSWNKLTRLENISFTGLISLDELLLSNNKINYIAPGTFQRLTKLSFLTLDNNGIVNLDPFVFSGLYSLTDLWLHSNKLTKVDTHLLQDLTSLMNLDFENNPIFTIEDNAFKNNPNVVHLNMASCRLTFIDTMTLHGFVYVRKLDFSSNQLLSVNKLAFVGLSSLEILDLSNNPITNNFPSLLTGVCNTNPKCHVIIN